MNKPIKAPRADFEAGKQRFLEAADRVYIKYGYNGTTIRAIAAEAKTSLARLNRHWSGKEDLFKDVFERHFTPIHIEQAARLDEIEKKRLSKSARLKAILVALLAPALKHQNDPVEQSISHIIYSRALVDPAPEARRIVTSFANTTAKRVIYLLRDMLPNPNPEQFFLMVTIVLGAYIHPQIFGETIAESMDHDFQSIDWQRASETMAFILEKGLTAMDKYTAK